MKPDVNNMKEENRKIIEACFVTVLILSTVFSIAWANYEVEKSELIIGYSYDITLILKDQDERIDSIEDQLYEMNNESIEIQDEYEPMIIQYIPEMEAQIKLQYGEYKIYFNHTGLYDIIYDSRNGTQVRLIQTNETYSGWYILPYMELDVIITIKDMNTGNQITDIIKLTDW